MSVRDRDSSRGIHARGLESVEHRLSFLEERTRLGPAILPEFLQENRPAIELRSITEVPIEDDARDVDRMILRVADLPRGDHAIDHLDQPQFLLEREVPGEL